ncbi:bifunctional RNase H/acid phosphatase [Kytococcus schroeteri]|uniref:Bifunctional RNase H/acid phosphatase n=1 Tax=Kytococcus schroeteri TaxID=138300 RepID=A0A2I1PB65_9MICO|nr:histidine phosphatase family protein [Kytococcus schroeteri]PKZ41863.1 bifunctional RNase H/acid phosphatase [Kytococcus schroeteri]
MATWTIEADGGSRGNPGVAGYGALVRDPAGALLAERAAPLGRASNNVAEYTGLLAGLQAVLDLADLSAGDTVAVRMDSKLVIEQMAGRWKIKHPDMQRLAQEAQGLCRQLRDRGVDLDWGWIPRTRNKAADALSNDGMDGRTVARDHVAAAAPGPRAVDAAGDAGQDVEVPDETHAPEPPEAVEESRPTSAGASVRDAGARRGHRWQLVLLRHGVTEFTETYRIDGRGGSNPPLSPLGEQQAARAGDALGELLAAPAAEGRVRVVTSSLRRAQQTGRAVADALRLEAATDARFDEQAFGDWDGRTWSEVDRDGAGTARAFAQDPACPVPGGETHHEVAERVVEGLRDIARQAVDDELHTVVVAAHRIAVMTALEAVLGVAYPRSWALGQHPAAFHTLEFVGAEVPTGFAELSGLNVRHHLEGLPVR